LAGSKFRSASLETISDVCDFVQAKLNKNDNYVPRRRRRRQTRSDIHLNSNQAQDVLNGLQNDRNKCRSNSIQQQCGQPLNDSSKRSSNEAILSSQFNTRRPSKVLMNIAEI
jgi:hypothetical protein